MKHYNTLILVLAFGANSTLAMSQVIDQVAVVVDNGIVIESDVNSMLAAVMRGAQKFNQSLPAYATLRRQVCDQLIMDNIMFQLAQRANLTISNEQLDQNFDNISANNHMTNDQLRRHLVYDGIDYNTYRMKIYKNMLFCELRNSKVLRRIAIAPQEVNVLVPQIAYQTGNSAEFNLSQILIPLPENPTYDQLNKATALANYLVKLSKSRAIFTKLAITDSADQQPIKVGKMGWKKLEELPSLFVTRLQGTQKEHIIDTIHSGVGFHILKVKDIRGCHQTITEIEVNLRHILLHTSMVITDQQVSFTLDDIASKIKSGHIGFNTAAKQLSEDPFSSPQGGNLGWSSTLALDPDFRAALRQLKINEVSTPVHSSFGWHLLQLIDIRKVVRTNVAQQDQSYRLQFNCRFAEESQTWMQEKRALAYVKIIDKYE
ncbi:Chaperone surA [Candidatus Moranella endobia PCVAL]|uniref:peptidylprolyl isomerase SurA n=1 Tax=Candidatus Moranella endobia TaxID=1048758 RepID=UPI0002C6DAE4|nr:peptidylprolyl isomerase SurA [Candidatus Moranella endobia]AGJ61371.1 Chaperone surA [Candidatus Moranella endobia PCVAL]